jgi:hypothetical protein
MTRGTGENCYSGFFGACTLDFFGPVGVARFLIAVVDLRPLPPPDAPLPLRLAPR